MSHKIVAFYTYLRRLIAVPLSPCFFDKAFSVIKQIAIEKGYEDKLVLLDKIFIKNNVNFITSSLFPIPDKNMSQI